MKSFFIGHGSPMNALSDNSYTRFLGALGRRIEEQYGMPEAIVVFSAHWLTQGTRITGSPEPPQIYDFYGFPGELYRLKYAPPGSPRIAGAISAGIPEITVDGARGIDHAAWAVARHLFPGADVPLLEISLDVDLSARGHFDLGKKIAALKLGSVLFFGSGNLVHNLRDVDFRDDAPVFPWADAANRWLAERLATNDPEALIEAPRLMPNYGRAAPTSEHFLPALYALGMATAGPTIEYDEIQNGSVSMMAFSVE